MDNPLNKLKQFGKNVVDATKKLNDSVDKLKTTISESSENLAKRFTEFPVDISKDIIGKIKKNLSPPVNPPLSDIKIFIGDRLLSPIPYGFFQVAFTNQGRTLICSRGDGFITFWDWLNSKVVKINKDQQKSFVELNFHDQAITALDVNQDERFLATASGNKPIKLWDIHKRQKLFDFRSQLNSVGVIKFSPDSQLLAIAGADNFIKILNIKSKSEILTLSGHESCIRSLSFSEDSEFLAGASDDGNITIWNLSTGKIVRTFLGHRGGTYSILFNSKKQVLISGGHDHLIKVWDIKGNLIYEMKGHQGSITCLAISCDEKTLASGSFDKTIKIWNFKKKKLTSTIETHSQVVTSLAFSPTDQILASSSIDESVKVWDINFLNNKSKLWVIFSLGILFSIAALIFNIVIFNTDNNQCLNILGDCINQHSYKTTLILSLNFIVLLLAIFLTTILFKACRSPLRAILSVVKMSVLERIFLSIETLVITLTRIIALFGREG